MNQPIHPQGADFTVGDRGADVEPVDSVLTEERARGILQAAKSFHRLGMIFKRQGNTGGVNKCRAECQRRISYLRATYRRCQGTPV